MTENEAKGWKSLAATYAQCVSVAIEQWDGLIGLASMAQQKMAEEMRDRLVGVPGHRATANDRGWLQCSCGKWDAQTSSVGLGQHYKDTQGVERDDASIHVPLFTPRDRLQFLKEVSVTLLIEASKRGLSVTEPEDVGPAAKPFGKDKGTPVTAMSTEDLESSIAWCRDKGERLIKYGDFVIAADAEAHARAAATQAIQTQPLTETPLALVPDDRPLPEAP